MHVASFRDAVKEILKTDEALYAEIEAAVKANTAIFNELGLESVPFVAAKNGTSGVVQVNAGAMETPALTAWLGLAG